MQHYQQQGNGGGDAQYDDGYFNQSINKRQYQQEYGEPAGGANPPKRSRGGQQGQSQSQGSGKVELRLLIPSRSAGGIIGKKGSNIKDMRDNFDAQIQIPDSQSMERVLRVFADVQSCGEIILRVIPAINEERRDDRFDATIKLLVHQSQAGTIIGTKGFKIKELREKTGATIKIHQECCPNSTDRICQISGKPEVVSECLKLILELVETAPPKGLVIKYDPNSEQFGGGFGEAQTGFNQGGGFSDMGMGGGGGYGGGAYQQPTLGPRGGGFNSRGGGFRGNRGARGGRGGFGGRGGGRGGRGFGGGGPRGGGRGRGRGGGGGPVVYDD